MPTNDVPPDLHALEGTYQILTELRDAGATRTYLARNVELNRDVTITVTQASGGPGADASLSQLAADAQRLITLRHPTVVPTLDTRWLAPSTLAVVHARVRGSTLDQVLGAVGPLPMARAGAVLGQINDALVWARDNGVAHRAVAPEAVTFQQGTERVLVTFDPMPYAPARGPARVPDACDDARTIGQLAWSMLAGQPYEAGNMRSLTSVRRDVPPELARATDALLACRTGGTPPAIAPFLALFGAGAAAARTAETTMVASTPGSTVVASTGASPARPIGGPTPARDADVVVVQRAGMSYGGRVAAVVVLVAVVIVAGIVYARSRATTTQITASVATPDTAAMGEVTTTPPSSVATNPLPPGYPYIVQPDTGAAANVPVGPPPGTAMGAVPAAPVGPVTPMPVTPMPPAPAAPARPVAPPVGAVVDTAMSARPDTVPARVAPVDTSATTSIGTGGGGSCASPAPADQRTCLANATTHDDAALHAVYDQLIAALRRQAGVGPTDPDPATVGQLRSQEWQWLDTRDAACRAVGQPPLYAQARAQCYDAQTAARMQELKQALDAIPPPPDGPGGA